MFFKSKNRQLNTDRKGDLESINNSKDDSPYGVRYFESPVRVEDLDQECEQCKNEGYTTTGMTNTHDPYGGIDGVAGDVDQC